MQTRIFHGDLSPDDLAQALVAHFQQQHLRVQRLGEGPRIMVQIAARQRRGRLPKTALTVSLTQVPDGVAVQVGQQAWLGLAADLGFNALLALRNPWALLGRLDDIIEDFALLNLADQVWQVLEQTARALGAGHALSERLRRVTCAYCGVANEVGEPRCIACGAPLGEVQPHTCAACGFVLTPEETTCPNCGQSAT